MDGWIYVRSERSLLFVRISFLDYPRSYDLDVKLVDFLVVVVLELWICNYIIEKCLVVL